MTESEFHRKFDNFELDKEYADYIIKHSAGDRLICNGDALVSAMEQGYLFDSFAEYMIDKQ